MVEMVQALRQSVAARWREESEQHSPWGTTQIYYRGYLALAENAGDHTNVDVLVRQTQGAKSTFYTVSGPTAKRSLFSAYRKGHKRLVERYPVPHTISRLGHETVTWDYWAHRTGWLGGLENNGQDRPSAARGLLLVVADFAAHRPDLLRTVEWAPPICAVEDFAIVVGLPDPEVGYDVLHRVTTGAAAMPDLPAEAVVDGVERELDRLLWEANGQDLRHLIALAIDTSLSDPRLGHDERAAIAKMLRSASDMTFADLSELPLTRWPAA
jgi:hypothetical protein